MTKKRKYDVGKLINGEWVIVSILQVKKQNTKILCYHLKTKNFVEGWIWDFTRGLINPNKQNLKNMCEIVHIRTIDELEIAQDTNQEYAWQVFKNSKYLSHRDRYILESIRNGYLYDTEEILRKFDYLLKSSGQHRRNLKLAMLISSTYRILQLRNFF
jgi:hypothetical protein